MFLNKFGTCANVPCGLVKLTPNGPEALTLQGVEIESNLTLGVASVKLVQTFVNHGTEAVDTSYYFPVGSYIKVKNFKSTIYGQQEDQAESEVASPIPVDKLDTVQVQVGLVQPTHKIKICIDLIMDLESALKLLVPNTFTPRFTYNQMEEPQVPLQITVKICIQGPIQKIVSRTHNVQYKVLDPDPGKMNWTLAKVEFTGHVMSMGNGFALLISEEQVPTPKLYAERDEKSVILMLHHMPIMPFCQQKIEAIFLLDCSGSMSGSLIELAKSALVVFVKSLPMDCYFNIVAYGRKSKFLFKKLSKKYESVTLRSALDHIPNMKADLESTNMLEPFETVMSARLIPGYLRQIYILSDGDLPDSDRLIGICHTFSSTARDFALGIGTHDSSKTCLSQMANAGGGMATFITSEDDIRGAVVELFQNSFQPTLTNVQIEWSGSLLQQMPEKVKPVPSGTELLVLGQFNCQDIPASVKIEAESANGPLSIEINVSENSFSELTCNMIHGLYAFKREKEMRLKNYAQDATGTGQDHESEYDGDDSESDDDRPRPSVAKMSTGGRLFR